MMCFDIDCDSLIFETLDPEYYAGTNYSEIETICEAASFTRELTADDFRSLDWRQDGSQDVTSSYGIYF
jgi:hypothetical protein